MTHLVAGYPTFKDSLTLARVLARHASFLEIQIPFSEPVADGPTIVEACHTSLQNGFKVDQIFKFCKTISRQSVPILVMSYANPIYKMGIQTFCRKIKAAGVEGLIVPDLPFDSEEGKALRRHARENGLSLIQVVSPSMGAGRLETAIKISDSMIYCTTKRGTTGGRVSMSEDLIKVVRQIRKLSHLSIALGFRISSKRDHARITKLADVVVFGSAIIREFKSASPSIRLKKVSRFLEQLK